MDLPDRCPECDCDEIINDKYAYVCSDCGNIIIENIITENATTTTTNTNTNITNNIKVNSNKASFKNQHVGVFCRNYTSTTYTRLTYSVQLGIDQIYNVCKNLNLPNSITEMSVNVFKEIVREKPFKDESCKSKMCIAILCVYLVSNREHNPITLNELWKSTDCTFDNFGSMLLRLEKLYPEIYPNKTKYIESLVAFYLFKLTLNPKERPFVADYSTNLLWMWREALLVQAYNPIYVIYAAFYFAWKAVHSVERLNVSPPKFCSLVNIEFKPIIRERIKFFYKILQDFYRCCPLYVGGDVSKNLIIFKLKDMLQMKRIILLNYGNSKLNFHTQRIKQDEEKALNNNQKIRKEEKHETGKIYNDKYENDSDDFSDSEINSYIRTNEEVHTIVNLSQKE